MGTYMVLAAAFHIWMLVDAIRRRANPYWYFMILVVPFGALIYLAVVKLGEPSPAQAANLPNHTGPSQKELERRALETPSLASKLALAEHLLEEGNNSAAVARFRELLNQHRESKEGLHGIARALLALARPQEASDELAHLMELDPKFRDYSAALDYAEALWQSGEREDAIGLLTGLVGVSGRINHRVALAHYCKEAGQHAAAREQLELALKDFDSSPEYVQRRDERWAKRARQALQELPTA